MKRVYSKQNEINYHNDLIITPNKYQPTIWKNDDYVRKIKKII